MLDKNIYGTISKISPEAPIPIFKVTNETLMPGGAGNVCLNIRELGAQCKLIGFVGDDNNGKELMKILENNQIDCSNIMLCEKTIVKERVISCNQNIVRVDKDSMGKIQADILIESIKESLDNDPTICSVVLSDYGKGTCSKLLCKEVIRYCTKKSITIIVDPKGNDWTNYEYATFITPNINEVMQVCTPFVNCSNNEVICKSDELRRNLQIQNLLLTKSELGMCLINDNNVVEITSHAKFVRSVRGAGDAVVAVISVFMNNNIHLNDIVELASIAAGIAVEEAVPVSRVTLKNKLVDMIDNGENTDKKIVSLGELDERVNRWRICGHGVVFTNGCFDIFHLGHMNLLKQAKALGDKLIVAINSDDSIRKLKGDNRPINNEKDRALLLAALDFIDVVIVFDEMTPNNLISKIMPDIVVKGGDYSQDLVIGKNFSKVVILPYQKDYSTTKVINNILNIQNFEVINK